MNKSLTALYGVQIINSKLPQNWKNSGGVLVKVELTQITNVIETDFFSWTRGYRLES